MRFVYTSENVEVGDAASTLDASAMSGVMPEPANVASNTYPLTAPIYVISRTDLPSTSDLFNLRNWLQNMGGQRVLAEAGYMPMLNEAWTSGRLK